MNQCHFLGRLVAKPELKTVGGDKRVVNFRIAVDRRYKRGKETAKETAFLDCEAWDTGADLIAKHLDKGQVAIFHASVKQEEWEDKNTGQKRSKLKFRVNSFDFVPGANPKNGERKPAEQPDTDDEPVTAGGGGGGDEDIPF